MLINCVTFKSLPYGFTTNKHLILWVCNNVPLKKKGGKPRSGVMNIKETLKSIKTPKGQHRAGRYLYSPSVFDIAMPLVDQKMTPTINALYSEYLSLDSIKK